MGERLFCFYVQDQLVVVQVTGLKRYYFDYKCLYPYTGVFSTYFNETENFISDNRKVKFYLENIFGIVKLVFSKSFSESIELNRTVSQEDFVSVKRVNGLNSETFNEFDGTVVSRELGLYLRAVGASVSIETLNRFEEVSCVYDLILKSKIFSVHFFYKSRILFDNSTSYKTLGLIKFCNPQNLLKKYLTDFYFSEGQQTICSSEVRISSFNMIDDKIKLQLYLRMINTKSVIYYDDLLKIWWQNRY